MRSSIDRCLGRNSQGMSGAVLASKLTVTVRSAMPAAGPPASATDVVPP